MRLAPVREIAAELEDLRKAEADDLIQSRLRIVLCWIMHLPRRRIVPKDDNLPIVRGTLCQVKGHVFIWAASITHHKATPEPPDDVRCHCGLYSYAEWKVEARDA